jgi:hypothetical protein
MRWYGLLAETVVIISTAGVQFSYRPNFVPHVAQPMVPALDAAVVEVRWDCCRSSGSAFVWRYLVYQLIPSELRCVKGLAPITAVGRLEPADHRHANARLRR